MTHVVVVVAVGKNFMYIQAETECCREQWREGRGRGGGVRCVRVTTGQSRGHAGLKLASPDNLLHTGGDARPLHHVHRPLPPHRKHRLRSSSKTRPRGSPPTTSTTDHYYCVLGVVGRRGRKEHRAAREVHPFGKGCLRQPPPLHLLGWDEGRAREGG